MCDAQDRCSCVCAPYPLQACDGLAWGSPTLHFHHASVRYPPTLIPLPLPHTQTISKPSPPHTRSPISHPYAYHPASHHTGWPSWREDSSRQQIGPVSPLSFRSGCGNLSSFGNVKRESLDERRCTHDRFRSCNEAHCAAWKTRNGRTPSFGGGTLLPL